MPRSSMPGSRAWVRSTSATTFTISRSWSRSGSISSNRPPVPKPALLTSRSTRIPRSASSRATCRPASGRARSCTTTWVLTPWTRASSAATSSSRSRERATRTRSWPRAASWAANSVPSPEDAPVTSAVLGTAGAVLMAVPFRQDG
ncbi:hypothetical protein CF54_07265 [Streptomyces sp. Tu 6176]|nr:hypothetical protein CF54_07265 [Streptomyces sp. Tu 6176]